MIDTHCHLNDEESFPDAEEVIREAIGIGVSRMVVIGINEPSCLRAIELAEAHPEIHVVIGWHPNYAHEYNTVSLANLRTWAEHPKCVAIGETGADFHWQYATWEQQERAFRDQLALAAELSKPVVLHCRKASEAMLQVLEADPPMTMVWHCFGGSADDLRRFKSMDGYLGVDGPVTYPKSTELRELLHEMPLERMLLETDSPYLTPHPFRGKRNTPAKLPLVLAACADELGMTSVEFEKITDVNARRFYGLD